MGRSLNRAAAAAAIMVLGLVSAGSALAGKPFDERTLRGTWALFVRGHVATTTDVVPFDPGTPLVAVATVTFDGEGNCASIDQLVVGGMFIPSAEEFREAVECTYFVNEDGTGGFTVVFPIAPSSEETAATVVTFVITDPNELHFIANSEDAGIFGGGVMQRQQGSRGPRVRLPVIVFE